jgi:hypothetical protein
MCDGVNNEPEILAGFSPDDGQSVAYGGQIKAWVTDEWVMVIAPNEQIDPNTGAIAVPGDRTARGPDGYLWEPALYVAPENADNGGTPHFPTAIKGIYNSTSTSGGVGKVAAGMDPIPAGATGNPGCPGTAKALKYTSEIIWDVKSLGIGPGKHLIQLVVHDGDEDLGVGCLRIVVTP